MAATIRQDTTDPRAFRLAVAIGAVTTNEKFGFFTATEVVLGKWRLLYSNGFDAPLTAGKDAPYARGDGPRWNLATAVQIAKAMDEVRKECEAKFNQTQLRAS